MMLLGYTTNSVISKKQLGLSNSHNVETTHNYENSISSELRNDPITGYFHGCKPMKQEVDVRIEFTKNPQDGTDMTTNENKEPSNGATIMVNAQKTQAGIDIFGVGGVDGKYIISKGTSFISFDAGKLTCRFEDCVDVHNLDEYIADLDSTNIYYVYRELYTHIKRQTTLTVILDEIKKLFKSEFKDVVRVAAIAEENVSITHCLEGTGTHRYMTPQRMKELVAKVSQNSKFGGSTAAHFVVSLGNFKLFDMANVGGIAEGNLFGEYFALKLVDGKTLPIVNRPSSINLDNVGFKIRGIVPTVNDDETITISGIIEPCGPMGGTVHAVLSNNSLERQFKIRPGTYEAGRAVWDLIVIEVSENSNTTIPFTTTKEAEVSEFFIALYEWQTALRVKSKDDITFTYYQLAIKEGFKGTLEEWLAFLTGPKGNTGILNKANKDERTVYDNLVDQHDYFPSQMGRLPRY